MMQYMTCSAVFKAYNICGVSEYSDHPLLTHCAFWINPFELNSFGGRLLFVGDRGKNTWLVFGPSSLKDFPMTIPIYSSDHRLANHSTCLSSDIIPSSSAAHTTLTGMDPPAQPSLINRCLLNGAASPLSSSPPPSVPKALGESYQLLPSVQSRPYCLLLGLTPKLFHIEYLLLFAPSQLSPGLILFLKQWS